MQNPGRALKAYGSGQISPEKRECFYVPACIPGQRSLGQPAALLVFSAGGEDEKGETGAEEDEEQRGGVGGGKVA